MSQRQPDYEDLRARQARAQEGHVTACYQRHVLAPGIHQDVPHDHEEDQP